MKSIKKQKKMEKDVFEAFTKAQHQRCWENIENNDFAHQSKIINRLSIRSVPKRSFKALNSVGQSRGASRNMKGKDRYRENPQQGHPIKRVPLFLAFPIFFISF